MAQAVECLPCEDLSLIFRTWEIQAWRCVLGIPAPRRQRQADPWMSLGAHPSLTGQPKSQKTKWTAPVEWHLRLASYLLYACIHACMCTPHVCTCTHMNEYTYTQTNMLAKANIILLTSGVFFHTCNSWQYTQHLEYTRSSFCHSHIGSLSSVRSHYQLDTPE